jgi:DNA-directed RNA polymerase subunit RPC12/RpoP
MKCIYCGADSKLRERTNGRCPRCRHPFAFEPTKDRYKVTDTQFERAVERVSGEGKVQFTERHLWYEFNRRWMKPGFWRRPWGALPFAGAGTGAVAAALTGTGEPLTWLPLMAVGLAAGVGIGVVGSRIATWRAPAPPRPPRIPLDVFQRQYLGRYREVHGGVGLPGLLPVREAALPAAPREVPSDVAAFSFDRAVVTDRWETAQMLVANRFHFEHNCAVLSRDGYPDGIADTVKEMLRRNPRLTVFALHDASPGGCLLPLRLREPEWFPDPSIRIVDLGLRPEMVRRLRMPALAGPSHTLPARLGEILPPEDVAWLAMGHVGELAALRPAQVLRAAYQGIVAAGPHDGSTSGVSDGGGGGTYGGGVIWIGGMGGGGDTAAVDGFG